MIKDFYDAILNLLKEFGVIDKIKERAKRAGPTWKAKGVAYVLAPGFILAIAITFGSGKAIDFNKGLTLSELQTETAQGNEPVSRKSIVVIAEPNTSSYEIPIKKNSSKIWSSLDAEKAQRNADIGHFRINGTVLHVHTPFYDVNEPVLLLIEGELDRQIEVLGETESIDNWRLVSRSSTSVVYAVLVNCFFALGIGLASAATPINGDKNYTSQIGTEPNEESVIQGNTVES
jgi:hypothetical protein